MCDELKSCWNSPAPSTSSSSKQQSVNYWPREFTPMPPLLNSVECPECNTPGVFMWSDGPQALCARCYAKGHTNTSGDQSWQIILAPICTAGGNWTSGESIKFPELRQYIDDCLANDHRRYDANLLTADERVIESLIQVLSQL